MKNLETPVKTGRVGRYGYFKKKCGHPPCTLFSPFSSLCAPSQGHKEASSEERGHNYIIFFFFSGTLPMEAHFSLRVMEE